MHDPERGSGERHLHGKHDPKHPQSNHKPPIGKGDEHGDSPGEKGPEIGNVGPDNGEQGSAGCRRPDANPAKRRKQATTPAQPWRCSHQQHSPHSTDDPGSGSPPELAEQLLGIGSEIIQGRPGSPEVLGRILSRGLERGDDLIPGVDESGDDDIDGPTDNADDGNTGPRRAVPSNASNTDTTAVRNSTATRIPTYTTPATSRMTAHQAASRRTGSGSSSRGADTLPSGHTPDPVSRGNVRTSRPNTSTDHFEQSPATLRRDHLAFAVTNNPGRVLAHPPGSHHRIERTDLMDASDSSVALPTPARPAAVTGMAIHVGVYLRQSERRTTGSEASTAAQHEECLKALEQWDVPPAHVEVYEDLGISAFKNVERPAYERLLRDVRAGRINVIMVHYMSRLSRKNAAETYDELRPLLTNRVRIISVGEHREFHTDNPLALMELLFKLQANHEESLNKSRAIKTAKALEASLGGYTGKPPLASPSSVRHADPPMASRSASRSSRRTRSTKHPSSAASWRSSRSGSRLATRPDRADS